MPDHMQYATSLEVHDDVELRLAQYRHRHPHERQEMWAVAPKFDVRPLFPEPLCSHRRTHVSEAVFQLGDEHAPMLHLRAAGGEFMVRILAVTVEELDEVLSMVREKVPVHDPEDRDVIPVTFWTAGAHGPVSHRRELDAEGWDAISDNYQQETRKRLDRMMGSVFEPGKGGQLILWHGAPGTGKTTALRCLAREWREWCDMHYIVDPDRFFGDDAAYMMTVLLGDQDEPVLDGTEVLRWRVLLLEDCGELLQPDARRDVGQALSRLLNACDGMIGRGLRIMLLLTTNEPAEKLHRAVSRPGRCAANIEFQPFAPMEADEWLREHGGALSEDALGGAARAYEGNGKVTLADLFGIVEDFQTRSEEQTVGFR